MTPLGSCKGGVVNVSTLTARATAKAAISASDAGAATAESSAEALNAASAASGRKILPGPSGEASEAESRAFITLIFKDNGRGMDAETSAHAFDPFFSTKPKSTGSVGLGLSTGYGIIQQSGGTISVTSVLDKGTERKKTILLVEDEIAVRKLVSQVLRNNGFEVLEAKDGKEWLATFHAKSHAIDIVVPDVVMPKMSVLAMNMPHEHCAFLHKPFSVANLLEKIDESIHSKPMAAST